MTRMPSVTRKDHPYSGIGYEYIASELDDTADTLYFGSINHIGEWVIGRYAKSSGSIRYASGKVSFPTNWTNRASLTYDYYNLLF